MKWFLRFVPLGLMAALLLGSSFRTLALIYQNDRITAAVTVHRRALWLSWGNNWLTATGNRFRLTSLPIEAGDAAMVFPQQGFEHWDVLGFGWQRQMLLFPNGVRQYHFKLILPGYALMLLSSIPVLLWVRKRVRTTRRLQAGLCPACGFDLRATPERCPECGKIA